MLSEHEQKIWDEIERNYQAEPDAARSRSWTWTGGRVDLPAPIIGGAWGTVLLVLFGVPSAGVAIGVATGLLWLLWRFSRQLDAVTPDAGRITADVGDRTDAADRQPARPAHQRPHPLPRVE